MRPAQPLSIEIDRHSARTLSDQLTLSIETAILDGRLAPGARLPSWRDLASQLGVARGTVKVAYERLIDKQLLVSHGPAGTRVSDHLPPRTLNRETTPHRSEDPFRMIGLTGIGQPPRLFQLGVPAQDGFPTKTWSRLLGQAARRAAVSPLSYPDPRGEAVLRREIVAYLAVGRSFACSEEQVFITSGFTTALGLIVDTLSSGESRAWIEDPGYRLAQASLALKGIGTVPVPVDAEGIDVAYGTEHAPDARFAIVTPGQQAPLGMTMSLNRRRALLDWAATADAFIIEDDYLGELQLKGRAAPALASLDAASRVIHVGTFSKTISPALRLGFLVVPQQLVADFLRRIAFLAPAPSPITQIAVASFISKGHFLRHLRRSRRLYTERRDLLRKTLGDWLPEQTMGGLALILPLPHGVDDVAIARRAGEAGLAPSPLSRWHAVSANSRSGLLLGVTNVTSQTVDAGWGTLQAIIADPQA